MRKFLTGVLLFAVCGSVALGADDDQSKKIALLPEQPRTMDQVIDRVTNNENHLYGKMREYSPLVETYIQNLKTDKSEKLLGRFRPATGIFWARRTSPRA